ncbi:MAG: ankyrin repeat domain-containing protein [Rickettsiales bacterium]|nr:ankyrin repeat domain-containing protein [Rickettsiales bacterium]
MNSELAKIIDKILEFSERSLLKISQESLTEVRSLIAQYVDILTTKFDANQAKEVINKPEHPILHIAARFGDLEQLKKVLSFIASNSKEIKHYVNLRDDDFLMPIHYAAKNGWVDVVKFLLAQGSENNPKSGSGDREWTPIHYAARSGHLEIIKILLNNGVDKETKTSFGLTPLIVAAEFGHAAILKYLLDNGAKKDSTTIAENYCMNSLHYAAIGGFVDAVLVLIEAGIDKEIKTTSGFNALQFAVSSGQEAVINLLLEKGANPEVVTNSGNDILHLATAKGRKESVLTVLKWGIGDVDLALKVAKANSNKEIIQELERYKKAIKNIFSLKKLPDNFSKTIRSFNKQSLTQDLIKVEDGISFNAYGILNLRKKTGIFNKEKLSLAQVANKNDNEALFDDLGFLEKTIGLYKS